MYAARSRLCLKLKISQDFLACMDIRRVFFFFQAEDGIRDIGVTGVQTCALPILTIEHPHLTFRNLGWSADTPRGESRASFDFDKPGKSFEKLKDELAALKPTVEIGRASCRERV